jgi:phage gp46-like protein
MDIGLYIDRNGVVDITGEAVDGLVTAAALSVLIPYGGWWQAPEFGSRLNTLQRAKLTNGMENTVREYLLESMRWLTELGLASTVESETSRNGMRIDYTLTVNKGARAVTFKHFFGAGWMNFYELYDVYSTQNIYE